MQRISQIPVVYSSSGTCLDYVHVAEDQFTARSGIFSAIFALHVYDSLYSHALAFSQVPSGIAPIENIESTY